MSGVFDISSLPLPYLAISSSTPTALVADTLWYNPSTNVWKRWTGSEWTAVTFGGDVPATANEGDVLVYQGGAWVAVDVLSGGNP